MKINIIRAKLYVYFLIIIWFIFKFVEYRFEYYKQFYDESIWKKYVERNYEK